MPVWTDHLRLRCIHMECTDPIYGPLYIVTQDGKRTVYCQQHFEALKTVPAGAAVTFTHLVPDLVLDR